MDVRRADESGVVVRRNEDRPKVSQMFLQPFIAYTTAGLWTFTEQSETTANWEVDGPKQMERAHQRAGGQARVVCTFRPATSSGAGISSSSPRTARPGRCARASRSSCRGRK